ncbi:hypothetical protein PPYR_06821 [Photinus pyralis]|uniref:Uncharacterized protein n=1 Tax=Photinus pyralis TaxID=7054 RepID=A0A5N4ANQ8_PHOPY|nr:hypothetical protein PPYR_06821 [Photinus pyralis]
MTSYIFADLKSHQNIARTKIPTIVFFSFSEKKNVITNSILLTQKEFEVLPMRQIPSGRQSSEIPQKLLGGSSTRIQTNCIECRILHRIGRGEIVCKGLY